MKYIVSIFGEYEKECDSVDEVIDYILYRGDCEEELTEYLNESYETITIEDVSFDPSEIYKQLSGIWEEKKEEYLYSLRDDIKDVLEEMEDDDKVVLFNINIQVYDSGEENWNTMED